MGKQKQIYLSDELYNQCRNINASEVITKLLTDYFMQQKSKDELIRAKENLEQATANILNEKKEQINKITLDIKKVEQIELGTEQLEIKRKQKLADKISECINNTKELFNIDITVEQAEKFLSSNKYKNIKDFMISNNIISELESDNK